jgi:hypothetical protein
MGKPITIFELFQQRSQRPNHGPDFSPGIQPGWRLPLNFFIPQCSKKPLLLEIT